MKRYYISTRTITQAERMSAKYRFLAEEMERRLILDGVDETEENNFELVSKLYDKSDKIINTILSCCEGNSYKGYWKDIEFLREAETERNLLDMQM